MLMNIVNALLLFTLLCSKIVYADVINGEIVFDKRPAKAVVFYEYKQSYKTVNGVINQKDKKFTEKVGVASYQGKLELKNNDQLEHNIFANDLKQNIKFDIGLMAPGSKQEISADWKENSIVRIGCKIHPKMRSYIANIPSDNYVSIEFEKKQKNVTFELEGVSPKSDRFSLLIAGMDSVELSLLKGESKEVDIYRKGKKKGKLIVNRT